MTVTSNGTLTTRAVEELLVKCYPKQRRLLTILGFIDRVAISSYMSDRLSDHRVVGTLHDVKVEAPLTRLTPWFLAGTLSTRVRPGYEIDVRARRVEHSLGAGADWDADGGISLTVGVRRYRNAFYRYVRAAASPIAPCTTQPVALVWVDYRRLAPPSGMSVSCRG